LKPAWANSSQDPISKNLSQKKVGGVAQGEGPDFKPQYQKKQTNKQKKTLRELNLQKCILQTKDSIVLWNITCMVFFDNGKRKK
jgi:hypothetical protein